MNLEKDQRWRGDLNYDSDDSYEENCSQQAEVATIDASFELNVAEFPILRRNSPKEARVTRPASFKLKLAEFPPLSSK